MKTGVLVILFLLLISAFSSGAADFHVREIVLHPASAPSPLDNPLKGWATYVTDNPIYQPYSMVYFYLPWRELEPEEGIYHFAEWEKRAWSDPRVQGKHIIIRVHCDFPGKPIAVPQWLIDKGVKMNHYTDYGGGISPDYDDPRFIEAAERLIAALGKRYDSDPRIAFWPLAILGHWGEWHTYPRVELFASQTTQKRIIDAYHRAFPHKMLQARYADGYAGKQAWLGYHDDYFPDDTDAADAPLWMFLPTMRKSGRIDNWKVAPIGGEMVPRAAERELGQDWKHTMKMVNDAHMTWIGPYSPAMQKPETPVFDERCHQMVRRMGYEYRLTEIKHPGSVRTGGKLAISIKGVNQGVAPFYYKWPVELALFDSKGAVAQVTPLSIDIRKWLPGEFKIQTDMRVKVRPGTYKLAIGIRDPWTKKPDIGFANALKQQDGWTLLTDLMVM